MIRLTLFVIVLLLAVDAIEPTSAWLVTLAVLAGIELFSPRRRWLPRLLRPWPSDDWW